MSDDLVRTATKDLTPGRVHPLHRFKQSRRMFAEACDDSGPSECAAARRSHHDDVFSLAPQRLDFGLHKVPRRIVGARRVARGHDAEQHALQIR